MTGRYGERRIETRRNRSWGGAWGAVFGMALVLAVPALGNDKPQPTPTPAPRPVVRLTLEPAKAVLKGLRQQQQLLASAMFADGSAEDLTHAIEYVVLTPEVISVSKHGLVKPLKDGKGMVAVRQGSHEAMAEFEVQATGTPQPVSFLHEVVPSLTRARCNSGACHGTPSGKNGFRLSLQGYLPDQDFEVLTREAFGRRTNLHRPAASLILAKGTGKIPHEGGKKLFENEESYRVLEQWIGEGCRPSAAWASEVRRLHVMPGKRLLRNQAKTQQLSVTAEFADGSKRDVTHLVLFSSSDEQTARVSKNGLVTFQRRGSVAVICRYLHFVENARLSYVADRPNFVWSGPKEHNFVDHHVFAKLRELQIAPSELCTDEEFLRRLTLDVTGTLPREDEVRAFLADRAADKRSKWIDRVLESPHYADFWALKWADVLRSSRKKVAYRGAHNFRRYLVDVFARNVPFDQFVTELLTSQGDTMTEPAANYYRVARDPQDCAETTAQLFLGVRMQCAKCHNHPFERWTQDDYYGLAACFSRVRYKKPNEKSETEIVFVGKSGEVTHLRTGQVLPPKAPGAEPFAVAPSDDRRVLLARWLTSAQNPYFAKSVVNRVWFHLMTKGIVEPVDDFRDSNPPCNEELLEALAADFVKHGYDVKHAIRVICNSATYQLSSRPNATNVDDERYFSRAYPKLMAAEPLLDAISFAADVPEKFAGLPLGTRAIQLPDSDLEHPFLQAFGQPTRELACECGRESESSLPQALNLINGDTVHAKLRDPNNRIGRLLAAKKSDAEIVAALYLAALSRPARPEELATAERHIAKVQDRRRGLEDVLWALINCKEFLFRH